MRPEHPTVSIICPTYNQERFIAQALVGFVMQKTTFPFEIIVHDDASTDNTAAIVKEYEAKYPHLFANIYQTENQFSKSIGNVGKITYAAARGKYVALCEGDDFWTDSLKLQKQVDFLEANPDYTICFHNVKIIYEDGSQEPHLSNVDQKHTTTFADLACGNYIHTVSCVFRNVLETIPEWFYKMPVGDWTLHLLNAEHGKIGYIDEMMAAYRVHQGGIWSMKKQEENYLKWIPIVEQCRRHFYPRGNKEFSEQLARLYSNLGFAYFDAKRYEEYRQLYKSGLPYVKYLNKRSLVALTNRYLMSFFPQIAARYSGFRTQE